MNDFAAKDPLSVKNHETNHLSAGVISGATVDVRNVSWSLSRSKQTILHEMSFDLSSGRVLGIVGPNGAGKSTLLKAVIGVQPILAGQVHIFDNPIKNNLQKIAYVPQRVSVDWDFPTNVIDVVQMGLYRQVGLLGRMKGKQASIAMECLDRVGMADLWHKQIGQLSGGQQQRVFLARALAQDAEIYLLDEPFSGVDAATERAIIDVLKSLKSKNKSVIAVHHDLATVRDYFDYVLMINIKNIAEGLINDTFTNENLQSTYGGKLELTHAEELFAPKDLATK